MIIRLGILFQVANIRFFLQQCKFSEAFYSSINRLSSSISSSVSGSTWSECLCRAQAVTCSWMDFSGAKVRIYFTIAL